MRFVNFAKNGKPTLGLVRNEEVIDLSMAAPDLPPGLRELLAAGPPAIERAGSAAKSAKGKGVRPLAGLQYLPPILNPSKTVCLGLNYAAHAAEGGLEKPERPILFARFPSSFVGHERPLIRPRCSKEFDYEGEMVAVIGQRTRHASAGNALSAVAGYSIFNDGSIRDYQLSVSQWTAGKNFDGTGGFGPFFVTADELPPGGVGLHLQTRLNGNVMQDANTRDMVFNVAETIAFITEWMTLEPGDVLVTGTPSGVGFVRKPPVLMKAGDVCEIEIENIGLLRNPIVDEE